MFFASIAFMAFIALIKQVDVAALLVSDD